MKKINFSLNLFIITLLIISICSNTLRYTNSLNEEKTSEKVSHKLIKEENKSAKNNHLTRNDLIAINTGRKFYLIN